MQEIGIAFLFAFVLAMVHFMAEELEEMIGGYREPLISFGSGVSITYIFVQLVPEFHRIALESSELIFVAPLIGFSSIHLAEKYVSKSSFSQREASKRFGEIHSAFLFTYHFLIGFLIASLLSQNAVSGILFFIPIVLHVAISSLSMSELHEEVLQFMPTKVIISTAPLIGVAFQKAGVISSSVFNSLFGLVIGMFMYVVIRDSIPEGENGRPEEFVAGFVLYLAVILIVQSI